MTGEPGMAWVVERQSERAAYSEVGKAGHVGRARTSSMHGKEQKDLMSAESARSVSRAKGVDRVRALQRVLYRCAKQDKDRRFHALYDKVARSDVLWKAGRGPREPRSFGVDGVSIDDVVDSGASEFLKGSPRSSGPGPTGRGRCGGVHPEAGQARPVEAARIPVWPIGWW